MGQTLEHASRTSTIDKADEPSSHAFPHAGLLHDERATCAMHEQPAAARGVAVDDAEPTQRELAAVAHREGARLELGVDDGGPVAGPLEGHVGAVDLEWSAAERVDDREQVHKLGGTRGRQGGAQLVRGGDCLPPGRHGGQQRRGRARRWRQRGRWGGRWLAGRRWWLARVWLARRAGRRERAQQGRAAAAAVAA